MRDPSRTRTQPLAAVLVLVLVLESDPAGRCCGAALLVDDSELGMSSPLSLPASTSTSTASLSTSTSTSTILRGRSMRGPAWAKQRARQRRLASGTVSGRRSDPASAARGHAWMAGILAAPIPMLEKLRGPLRSGILRVWVANSPVVPSAAAGDTTAESSDPRETSASSVLSPNSTARSPRSVAFGEAYVVASNRRERFGKLGNDRETKAHGSFPPAGLLTI